MEIHRSFWRTIFLSFLLAGIFSGHGALAADSTEQAGHVLRVLIPALAYGTTYYLDDQEGRSEFYKSFFTNIVVTYGLKSLIDKEGPDGSHDSFPSGHASTAFQGAAFIHRRYGFTWGMAAYTGAAFVGYSRIESDRHDFADVAAGAAIGILSSICFTTPYHGFTVIPMAGDDRYGIRLSRLW